MAASLLLLLGSLLPSAAAIDLRGVTWPTGTMAEKKFFGAVDSDTAAINNLVDLSTVGMCTGWTHGVWDHAADTYYIWCDSMEHSTNPWIYALDMTGKVQRILKDPMFRRIPMGMNLDASKNELLAVTGNFSTDPVSGQVTFNQEVMGVNLKSGTVRTIHLFTVPNITCEPTWSVFDAAKRVLYINNEPTNPHNTTQPYLLGIDVDKGEIVSHYKYGNSHGKYAPTTLAYDPVSKSVYSVGVDASSGGEIGIYSFVGTSFTKIGVLDSCRPSQTEQKGACLDPNINILFDAAGLLYVAYTPTGIGASQSWELATFQITSPTDASGAPAVKKLHSAQFAGLECKPGQPLCFVPPVQCWQA